MTFAHNKLTTVLWFDHGEGRKAAEFYARVFSDSHVDAGHSAPTEDRHRHD